MARDNLKPKKILYSRRQTAEAIGCCIDTVITLEKQGRLKPIRLTAKRGAIYYAAREVKALAIPTEAR